MTAKHPTSGVFVKGVQRPVIVLPTKVDVVSEMGGHDVSIGKDTPPGVAKLQLNS